MKQYTYKVVGVTFDTEDGKSRQDNIKRLFKNELASEEQALEPTFEPYEFEGEPALRVYVDGVEVGNIAADQVEDVTEISEKASLAIVDLAVNGHSPEDVSMTKDMIRDARIMIKDGIITEWDVEEYKQMMEEIKDDPIYSAAITFYIKEPEDDQPLQYEPVLTKKEAKRKAKADKKAEKLRRKEERKEFQRMIRRIDKTLKK